MNKKLLIVTFVFLGYVIWWSLLQLVFPDSELSRGYYADSYGVLALISGVMGLIVARKYGSFKSRVGTGVSLFSLGLLSQFLGQLSYSILYYAYGIENAYPAFGEIFYLATIPFYALGVINIALASGMSLEKSRPWKKIFSVLFPLLMVITSYVLFLRNYDATDLPGTIVLLDFIYPLGQSVFLSLALLTFIMTFKTLGGLMKKKVLLILLSLVFQYVADSTFIYEVQADIWQPAGFSDILFLFSYFIMGWALLQFDTIIEDLKRISTN